jgi:hypothetical protein
VTDERTVDVVVIGAGLAGLAAARELAPTREVVVLDKGRGVGGRIATRRLGVVGADGSEVTAIVDHGVPFLGDERRGAGGVTGLAKHLTEGLDVRRSHRVDRVEVHRGAWRVEGVGPDGRFEALRASALVVTAPVPQTLELLSDSGIELDPTVDVALRSVRYDPCLVVMAVLGGPSGLAPDGVGRPASDVVDLVVDHQLAGDSPLPAVTVRASPDASEALWSAPDDEVVVELLAASELRSGPVDGTVQVHRWRYARCASPLHLTHLVAVAAPPLVLGGDAFVGAAGAGVDDADGLDAARRSGRAAAGAL